MSKIVIINADDFGFSPAVNRGVLKACVDGLVTSVSLLMNAHGTREALSLVRSHNLDMGVHVNLVDGRPLGGTNYRYITKVDGSFVGLAILAARLLYHKEAILEARQEIYAQIECCLREGIHPSHLDSHKYAQVLPGLGTVFSEAAEHFGIKHLRNLREIDANLIQRMISLGVWRHLKAWQVLKSFVVSGMARTAQSGWPDLKGRTSDYFLGMSVMDFSSRTDAGRKGLENCLRLVQEGSTEIMCHPGLVDDALNAVSPYSQQRENELQALVDPNTHKLVESLAVSLVAWRDM